MCIGYQRVPVSGMTRFGYMTVTVHITYFRVGGTLQIWETVLNPHIEAQLDQVDRMTFKVDGQRKFFSLPVLPIKERSWEGVLYG